MAKATLKAYQKVKAHHDTLLNQFQHYMNIVNAMIPGITQAGKEEYTMRIELIERGLLPKPVEPEPITKSKSKKK